MRVYKRVLSHRRRRLIATEFVKRTGGRGNAFGWEVFTVKF